VSLSVQVTPGPLIAAFFGFGLILAFTTLAFASDDSELSGLHSRAQACVKSWPLAFGLSLVYVWRWHEYALAGGRAGLAGTMGEAYLQIHGCWVVLQVFLYFLLCPCRLYHQMPSFIQGQALRVGGNRTRGRQDDQRGLMGAFISDFIVAPASAAPLAWCLVGIKARQAIVASGRGGAFLHEP